MQQQRLVLPLLLLALAGTVVLAGSPLNVYTSCVMPDGVLGQCRSEPRVQAAPSDVQAGAVLELPIDMRLPCEDANRTCAENVDVAEIPIKPPSGPHIGSCSVTLMPWSPFPCTFSTQTFKGVEGQNKTNWCFTERTKPDEPGFEYARDLVTDGYNNLYHGRLPDRPCGGSSSSSSSNTDDIASSSSSSAGDSSSQVVFKPRYGKRFSKVLLTVNFRVAAGRQFDRTYWFQIGHAVVALGTCTEPTRWLGTDIWWSTTVDITHLQAYLEPGLPTRMSLANLISNTYNVPIWAEAKIQYFWERHKPSRPGVPVAPLTPTAAAAAAAAADLPSETSKVATSDPSEGTVIPAAAAAAAAAAVQTAWGSYSGPDHAITHVQHSQTLNQPGSTDSSSSSSNGNGLHGRSQQRPPISGRAAAAAADVPDEVLPLVPREEDVEAIGVLNGDGGRSWPRATFKLPHSLSEPGNIYRAQLLVTPKADACEEFWAMNPSGAETNNTCGGVTTGEPYREVRVYVNGQLAGFTPIYYTMYTGGVDPRLWSAIVASYTYSLPTYTFDLSPWLPQLNSHPRPSSSSSSSNDMPATATGHFTPSSSSSSDSRLPSILHKPAPSRRLTQDNLQAGSTDPHPHSPQQQQQQQQQERSASDATKQAAHTITVELGGATGNGWIVASTLLLWRAEDSDGQPVVVSGDQQVQVEVSNGFDEPLESECEALHGDVAVAGKCTLTIRYRSVEASSELRWQGHKWQAHVRYATAKYDNVITYNNDVNVTDGSLSWYQETHHLAEWSVTRQRPSAAGADGDDAADDRVLEQQPQQQQQQQQRTDAPAKAGTDHQQQQQQQHRRDDNSGSSVGPSHVITQSSVKYDWLNAGVVAAGGAFEYSFNTTLLEPTVYSTYATAAAGSGLLGGLTGESATGQAGGVPDSSDGGVGGLGSEGDGVGRQGDVAHVVTGEQRHYQRAIMLNVYNPQSPRCVVPDNATHTVSLHNSIGGSSSSSSSKDGSGVDEVGRVGGRELAAAASDSSCVRRWGTCGFCAAWLMSNEVEWGAQNC